MHYDTARSYWLTPAKRSHFPDTPTPSKCWWCGSAAQTREHRIKRTDMVREFGHQPSTDHLLISHAHVTTPMRGPKADVWKFSASLCAKCNNVRSKPFDTAQERFAKYLFDNQATIAKTHRIRFPEIFPASDAALEAENLRRYFVKHLACRMYDLRRPISENLVAFMDGAQPLRDVSFSFGFAPAVHEILDRLPRDESGILGDEDIVRFLDPSSGRIYELASDWTYRAFVLKWVYRWNSPEEPINPFSWVEVPMEDCELRLPAFFAPTFRERK